MVATLTGFRSEIGLIRIVGGYTQFGVSWSGMGQQPVGTDMRQSFQEEVMRQLWTQDEVTFHGEHFDLDRAQMTLRPIQQPHPPIWVAANGDAAIKRAARRGFTWYVNPHATYTNIKRQTELYHATAEAAGSEQFPRSLRDGHASIGGF